MYAATHLCNLFDIDDVLCLVCPWIDDFGAPCNLEGHQVVAQFYVLLLTVHMAPNVNLTLMNHLSVAIEQPCDLLWTVVQQIYKYTSGGASLRPNTGRVGATSTMTEHAVS